MRGLYITAFATDCFSPRLHSVRKTTVFLFAISLMLPSLPENGYKVNRKGVLSLCTTAFAFPTSSGVGCFCFEELLPRFGGPIFIECHFEFLARSLDGFLERGFSTSCRVELVSGAANCHSRCNWSIVLNNGTMSASHLFGHFLLLAFALARLNDATLDQVLGLLHALFKCHRIA